VLVDEHRTRPAELLPLGEEFAIRVEDLYAAVDPIGNEYLTYGVERYPVRLVEPAGRRPFPAPALDDRAVGGEFDDPCIGVAAMPVSDEDRAVRRDGDGGGPVEIAGCVTGHAWLAERHQHLAVGAELDHDVALAVLAVCIGDIDVALLVNGNTVRKCEHSGAKALDQLAAGVEFEHWRQVGVEAVPAAALKGPNALAVAVGSDGDYPAPLAPLGQFAKPDPDRVGVGQSDRRRAAVSAAARAANRTIAVMPTASVNPARR